MGAVHQVFCIPDVLFFFSSLLYLWHEFYFYKSVELREEDIGEGRAEDTALRYAGERFFGVANPPYILHLRSFFTRWRNRPSWMCSASAEMMRS